MPIYKSTANSNKQKHKNTKTQEEHKPIKVNIYAIVLCLSLILFLFLVLPFDNFLKSFLLGALGLFAYPLFASICILSTAMLAPQKYIVHKKYITLLTVVLIMIVLIIHLILTGGYDMSSYGKFLAETYNSKTSAGGIIFSLFVYPYVTLCTVVGAYIFSCIGLAITIGFLLDYIMVQRYGDKKIATKSQFESLTEIKNFSEDTPITLDAKQTKTKKEIAKEKLGLESRTSTIISSTMPVVDLQDKTNSRPMTRREYILTPPDIVLPSDSKKTEKSTDDFIVPSSQRFYENKTGKKVEEQTLKQEEQEYNNLVESHFDENFDNESLSHINDESDIAEQNLNDEAIENIEEIDKNEDVDNDFLDDEFVENETDTNEFEENIISKETEGAESDFHFPKENEKQEYDVVEIQPGIATYKEYSKSNDNISKPVEKPAEPYVRRNYVRPPYSMFKVMDAPVQTDEDCQDNIDKLEKVLEDFKIPAKVVAVTVGPAVTRYEITMPAGISVKKVLQHDDDIAMVLASNGGVRIEAPIPGKSAVGIEVPNKKITPVGLREIVESKEYAERVNPLSFVLGKDINGDIQFCNLDKMPHLLVAGSTGSGKSVCLNTMIISMICRSSPEDLRFILVDPKMVEFSVYEGLPHLLTPNVITDKDQAINAFKWAIGEMDKRYQLLKDNGVLNIKEYNNLQKVIDNPSQKWPYIIIVVDELADLMMESRKEIEDRIQKLAQKARAAGIHLVLATQRPSVDIITGTIKSNLPSRIAFSLTNFVDSKTVIDQGGAEKLLGMGDMLYKPQGLNEPRRVQGAFVSGSEVAAVVDFIKKNNQAIFSDDVEKEIKSPKMENGMINADIKDEDPFFAPALKWFIETGTASTSMIIRRFGVGFGRAGRIVDKMTMNKFISEPDGSKPRQVLITMDEYEKIFGKQD